MALYHFHVTQIKRSEGRTAVASAALGMEKGEPTLLNPASSS